MVQVINDAYSEVRKRARRLTHEYLEHRGREIRDLMDAGNNQPITPIRRRQTPKANSHRPSVK